MIKIEDTMTLREEAAETHLSLVAEAIEEIAMIAQSSMEEQLPDLLEAMNRIVAMIRTVAVSRHKNQSLGLSH